MQKFKKQHSARILIIYMISALLFLTSIELHIHTQDTAASADHGFAVAISTIAGDLSFSNTSDEINVSPDSVLKVKQISISLLAVFLLVSVMLGLLSPVFTGRIRESCRLLPVIPFHGTPPLRAPPQ